MPALVTAWQTAGAAAVLAANATASAWATANLTISAAVASVGVLKTAFMVEVLVKVVEQLQYRWEAFAAIFTSDTIAEATKRHEARLAEMNRTIEVTRKGRLNLHKFDAALQAQLEGYLVSLGILQKGQTLNPQETPPSEDVQDLQPAFEH